MGKVRFWVCVFVLRGFLEGEICGLIMEIEKGGVGVWYWGCLWFGWYGVMGILLRGGVGCVGFLGVFWGF